MTLRFAALPALLALVGCASTGPTAPRMERVEVAGAAFRAVPSGVPFVPWGFNYDHDERSRLIEEYWETEWTTVEEDFHEMRELGATVVRIHLQVPRFLRGPDEVDQSSIARLGRLLTLAEETGLRLDLTGLASYRKADQPAWYVDAPERDRWAIQARFWDAVAARCADSPAVFCYTLMNEPVSPAGKTADRFGGSLGGFHYVEVLTEDPGTRSRAQVTREWISTLTSAIRKRDPRRPVTVGMFYLFEVAGGLTLGPDPAEYAAELDFLSLHCYPKQGKEAGLLALLKGLGGRRPVVIQETFPLSTTFEAFLEFLSATRGHAAGWIGFYWGMTEQDYARAGDLKSAIMARWLRMFREEGPRFLGTAP